MRPPATIAIIMADGTETGDLVTIRMWPAPQESAARLAEALTTLTGPPIEGLSPLPSDEVVEKALKERGTVIINPYRD